MREQRRIYAALAQRSFAALGIAAMTAPSALHTRDGMKINPLNSEPLYQQVANDLRCQIASGKTSVGDRLPAYRELATLYGVSIMTINKAMAALVSEGTIHSRVGRGSFVARMPGVVRSRYRHASRK